MAMVNNKKYVVVSKGLVAESLKQELEPLKSFIKDNELPLVFLEDKETVADAEIHEKTGDLFSCLEGEAVFTCGGELADPWILKENELRAKEIRGGERIILKSGDMLWIPAGCTHQHGSTGVARLLIVKVSSPAN